jgi:Protein of unknown function (DUF4058)
MPMHDWTRVEPAIFHAFHHDWITELARALNRGLPPDDYYSLTEQQAHFTAETDAEFYRRKESSIAVRHVSGDRIVAMLEVVSPGNKTSRHAFQAFVAKACELLIHRVHLLLVDPLPPGRRDPSGIHAAIWEEVADVPFVPPKDKPLTLVAYECDLTMRAYIQPVAVGDPLPDMPLFVEPARHVLVPLETTYQAAFTAMPRRWRTVLEPE